MLIRGRTRSVVISGGGLIGGYDSTLLTSMAAIGSTNLNGVSSEPLPYLVIFETTIFPALPGGSPTVVHKISARAGFAGAFGNLQIVSWNDGWPYAGGSYTYNIQMDLQEWISVTDSGWVTYESALDGSAITVEATWKGHTASAIFTVPVDVSTYTVNGRIAGSLRAVVGRDIVNQPIEITQNLSMSMVFSSGQTVVLGAPYSGTLRHFYAPFWPGPGPRYSQDHIIDLTSGISITYDETFIGTGVYPPPVPNSVTISATSCEVKLTSYDTGGYDVAGTIKAHDQPYPDPLVVLIDRGETKPIPNPLLLGFDRANATPDFSKVYSVDAYSYTARLTGLFGASLGTLENTFGFVNPTRSLGLYVEPAFLALVGEYDRNEVGGLLPLNLYWKQYDAFTLSQTTDLIFEDCSDLAPSDGAWSASAGVGIATVAGNIEVDIPASTASPSIRRDWNFNEETNLSAYRYAKIRLRVDGANNLPIEIGFADRRTPPAVGRSGYLRKYFREAALDGEWIDIECDLCCADELELVSADGVTAGGAISFADYDAQWSRYPLPNPAIDTNINSQMWGITLLASLRLVFDSPSADVTVTVEYVKMFKKNNFTYSMYHNFITWGMPPPAGLQRYPFRGLTDGRVSLEVPSLTQPAVGPLPLPSIIDDNITYINDGYGPVGSDQPGISAVALPGLGDGFHDTTRTMRFLCGNGLLFDAGVWTSAIDLTGNADVKAQSNFAGISFYPGCGDAMGHGGGVFGGAITAKGAVLFRSNANGFVFDEDSDPFENEIVEIEDLDQSIPAGNGVVNNIGYYRTELPFGKAGGTFGRMKIKPRSSNNIFYRVRFNRWWRHRVSFRVPRQLSGGNPWNLDPTMHGYQRCAIVEEDVHYWRSELATPQPWAIESVPVTSSGGCSDPRMIDDHRGIIYLVYSFGGDVLQTRSMDDGETWESSEMAIANGTHPTINCGRDGTLVQAAYVSGVIKGRVRRAGDADWGSLLTFKDDADVNIAAENDTFHLVECKEGPGRWIMVLVVDGESEVSEWVSADLDGGTWKRVI